MGANTISRRNLIVGGVVAGGMFVAGGALTRMDIGSAARPVGGGTTRYPLRRLDVVAPRRPEGAVGAGFDRSSNRDGPALQRSAPRARVRREPRRPRVDPVRERTHRADDGALARPGRALGHGRPAAGPDRAGSRVHLRLRRQPARRPQLLPSPPRHGHLLPGGVRPGRRLPHPRRRGGRAGPALGSLRGAARPPRRQLRQGGQPRLQRHGVGLHGEVDARQRRAGPVPRDVPSGPSTARGRRVELAGLHPHPVERRSADGDRQ